MRPSPGTNTVRQLRQGPVSFSVATEIDNLCPRSSILVSLMRRVTSSGIGNTLNVDNCFSRHFSLRLKSILRIGAKRIYPFLAFKLFSASSNAATWWLLTVPDFSQKDLYRWMIFLRERIYICRRPSLWNVGDGRLFLRPVCISVHGIRI